MMDILSDEYWQNEFELTENDLDRIVKRMRSDQRSFSLLEIAKRIVRGRLKHGRDFSSPLLSEILTKERVLSWNKIDEWKIGSIVFIAYGGKPRLYKPYYGNVVLLDNDTIHVRLDDINKIVKYSWNARIPRKDQIEKRILFIKELIAESEQKKFDDNFVTEDEANIEKILLKHGTKIGNFILNAFENNHRFFSYNERWILKELLIDIPPKQLQVLHYRLIKRDISLELNEIQKLLHPSLPKGDIGLFSLYYSLSTNPQFFVQDNSKWKAIKPPPPPWHQAVGTHYVYDPETFQIILQPREKLKKAVAERLEELGYYSDVVIAHVV